MLRQKAIRHYTGDQGRQYHESKRAIPEAAFSWIARLRAEKIGPFIKPEDVVFEYGVGSGWNLAGFDCRKKMGCDVSDFLEAKVRSLGVEFVNDSQQIGESSVDAALCHHTLEHVLHPAEVLEELRRVLTSNGKLLLFVPFEKEKRYRRFDRAEPNHHLYSWNVQTLGNLVEEAGFKVIEAKVGPFGYDRFAAVWAQRMHIGEFGFRWLRRVLHLLKPALEVRVVAVKE